MKAKDLKSNRERLGYQEGVVSVIMNTLLFGLKYWAGIVSGSLALMADAWHTLSDSISSIMVIIGVKLSSQKASRRHPFGFGRWEQIVAIFIAFLLGIVAFEFLRESIVKLGARQSAHFGIVAIIVTIVSILVKEGLAQYAFFISKKTGNESIKADAWHHRSDALSSVVVLLGIFLRNYYWWIDGALGIVISGMLFFAVFDITRSAIRKLLGEQPKPELVWRVSHIANLYFKADVTPHHFHIHDYGNHQELTFHIKVEESLSVREAHDLASSVEQQIREKLGIEATIHIEPEDADCE